MLTGNMVKTFVATHRLHATEDCRKLSSRLLSESVSFCTLANCKYSFSKSYKITKYPEINPSILKFNLKLF
jgi:hypothetical protein